MQTEIEAKFLHIDHEAMREKLRAIGAECVVPKRTMYRKHYDLLNAAELGTATNQRRWVRIRDEGDKVTMSYKQMDDRSLHGTKEVCLTIDSFEQAEQFLAAIGMLPKGSRETKRESWRLGDTEIDLDDWPWIDPYLEIEGPSEAAVRDVANQLGLNWDAAKHGNVVIAYMDEYDVTDKDIEDIPDINFSLPVPGFLEAKRKK
jgi:adenylate cyclase class 2